MRRDLSFVPQSVASSVPGRDYGPVTVYVAEATPLCDDPLATAIAWIVVVPAPTWIGVLYTDEEVLGIVPSVV